MFKNKPSCFLLVILEQRAQYRRSFTVDNGHLFQVSVSIFTKSLAVVLGFICIFCTKAHKSLGHRDTLWWWWWRLGCNRLHLQAFILQRWQTPKQKHTTESRTQGNQDKPELEQNQNTTRTKPVWRKQSKEEAGWISKWEEKDKIIQRIWVSLHKGTKHHVDEDQESHIAKVKQDKDLQNKTGSKDNNNNKHGKLKTKPSKPTQVLTLRSHLFPSAKTSSCCSLRCLMLSSTQKCTYNHILQIQNKCQESNLTKRWGFLKFTWR